MQTTEDFIRQYEAYNDEELYKTHSEIDQYFEEAKDAFSIVLNNRGGIEKIKENLMNKRITMDEVNRVKAEILSLRSAQTDSTFVKNLITSDLLSKSETDRLVEESFREFNDSIKANSIDAKSLLLALAGIIVSSMLTGLLWSWIVEGTERVPIFLIAGLASICYFTVVAFTRKSKTSILVIISTLVAIFLSFLVSQVFMQM